MKLKSVLYKIIICAIIIVISIMVTTVSSAKDLSNPDIDKLKNYYYDPDYKPAQIQGGAILGDPSPNGNHTIDEVLGEAQGFIDAGKNEGDKIDSKNLQTASDTLYNVLLGIGIFLTVAVGMYLAIKFMISSVEEKAQVKESLIPYIAGCIVIFGAFTIWKLAIILLSGIA